MKIQRNLIFLVLFGLICGCCSTDGPSESGSLSEQSVLLQSVEGDVTVRLTDKFIPAVKGQKLSPGNVVKAGANGLAVILYPGKYTVYVDKNSEVSIKSVVPSAKKGFFGTVFHLFKGMIYSDVTIDVKQGDAFQVETDHVVAGVHGTKFLVKVDPSGTASDVYVMEGVVKVRGLGLLSGQDIKEELIEKFHFTKIKQNSVPLPPALYNDNAPPFDKFWTRIKNENIMDRGSSKYKNK